MKKTCFIIFIFLVLVRTYSMTFAESDRAKPTTSLEETNLGEAKLQIVAVPIDVSVCVVTRQEWFRNKMLFDTVFVRNASKMSFDTVFFRNASKLPAKLSLSPGQYIILVKFADKPDKGDSMFGESYRREMEHAPNLHMSSISLNNNTGERVVRLLYSVELVPDDNIFMPLHLLPTIISLKEALKHYPAEQNFKLQEAVANKELTQRGLKPDELVLVVSGLKRGGIVYVPGEKNSAFLVQVKQDGRLLFTDKESVAERYIAGLEDVNAKDDISNSPLHNAVSTNRKVLIELLLAKGANVNAKGFMDKTPLHIAAEKGYQEITALLIKKGADVNVDDDRRTPLHIAAEKGYQEIAALLIENDADVNTKGFGDNTPLHIAAANGQKEIATLLIQNGADVNVDDDRRTPLHIAAEKGYQEIAALLIENDADVNTKGFGDNTPLHIAAANGQKEIAALLIQNGAHVNAKGTHGASPLHEVAGARGGDRYGVAELLVSKGADVNARNRFGETVLHKVAANGQKEIAALLIQNGADVNAKDNWGATPLHDAAEAWGGKSYEVVELLINKGADVNAKDSSENTPLKCALENNNDSIVEVLRKHGAEQ